MVLLIRFLDLKIFRDESNTALCGKLDQRVVAVFIRAISAAYPMANGLTLHITGFRYLCSGSAGLFEEGYGFHVLTVTHRNRLCNTLGNPP